jgi:hypothetical protein
VTSAAGVLCEICGIPADAGYFDDSSIRDWPGPTDEVVLATCQLPRGYCGVLHYFAQFTDTHAADPTAVDTPDIQWQIRCDGQPRDPYHSFNRIINPWGLSGFPIHLRLEDGCLVELVVRNVAPTSIVLFSTAAPVTKVGGRLLGRYWYNPLYGGKGVG